MRHRALPCVALLCLLLPSPVRAQRKELETEDLRLIYLNPTQTYLVPHAARCFENSMRFQKKLWDYKPSERVTVLLNDFSDSGNAAASATPRDALMLEISPLSLAYETVSANERMSWLMNHELVHVSVMDHAAGGDRFFRKLFGGKVWPIPADPESILYFYLTTPRAAAPRWYQEGIAVFVETWMAAGLGRAQGAWDEMVFRSMVKDDARFYDPLGLASEGTAIDFQVGVNNYLYGTRFMSYLAYTYGPDSLVRWVDRVDGTRRYYASQFKQVYGKSLGQAWREWVAWEHDFQNANLAAIRQYPTTPYRDLSPRALGSVSRAFYDPDANRLYAAFNYPGVVGHIGAISLEDGRVDKVVDVKQPSLFTVSSLAWDPASKTLFYTADNHAYRDLMEVDPKTKQARMLLKDARIGDLAFDRADRSLWGVRHFNGIVTLVRIPYPYTEWKQVHSWPYGEVIYDLDVSPDGRFLSASVGGVDGRHALQVMSIESLLKGDVTPAAQTSFGTAIPLNFVFTADGTSLYGSSYYTGVSNIFRYQPATGAVEGVSNTETGFFRPLPMPDGSLVVFRYSGRGFVPARIDPRPLEDVSAISFLGHEIVEKYPALKDWAVGSPAAIPLDSMIQRDDVYAPFKKMGLESVYPVAVGYKDFAGFGFRLNVSDPASINKAGLTLSYTPDRDLPGGQRVHLNFDFKRYDWRAGFKYNGADFYDLFGPTKRSRKGYSVSLGHSTNLVYDDPRRLDLELDGALYGNLERLPDYQNIAVDFKTLVSARARLSYSNVRSSLGHVDDEKGHKWDVVLDADQVHGKTFPRLYSDLDAGLPVFGHSSLWLRSSAGFSPKDREDPFANFYFGGFGNNWVDFRDEKRYREQYAFPGVELNEIGGRNYARSMLEWNLPPIRFRGAGTPGFYASWARPALFVSTIATNLDASEFRRVVSNVGVQVDIQLSVLSRLDMMLSAGYARAFEEGAYPRDEVMVSLKVLK